MIDTFINMFRVPELRRKLLATILLLAVCRIGIYITVPGVDSDALEKMFEKLGDKAPILNMVNMFAGGGLGRLAVFGLGVMPYISASIIFQLLGSVIPVLERLKKEGEAGRQKINQYTRYATVALCMVQGAIVIGTMRTQSGAIPSTFGPGDVLLAALLMTTGTMFMMWIGEQIDEYGIGSGISLIIMVGIIARIPSVVSYVAENFTPSLDASRGQIGIPKLVLMLVMFIGVIVAIIFITQGQRRIPFQQAKQTRGRRVYGGMRHYLPIQVNAAGVIPIIFAQALLMFPSMLTSWGVNQLQTGAWTNEIGRVIINALHDAFRFGSFIYIALYVVLIFFFCYFWTAIQFNPTEMADNLKEHGSFIPGIRPGRRTAEYLERVMTRITLPGAAFLSVIAIMPLILASGGSGFGRAATFYGGTGMLIVVGVALDLVRRIEAQLLIRHYDGFTKRTKRRR